MCRARCNTGYPGLNLLRSDVHVHGLPTACRLECELKATAINLGREVESTDKTQGLIRARYIYCEHLPAHTAFTSQMLGYNLQAVEAKSPSYHNACSMERSLRAGPAGTNSDHLTKPVPDAWLIRRQEALLAQSQE